jgi:AraC family transcriptional regulator of adaptative response/methylated-DNA-[protein]-cysteine methyltransferase
MAADPDSIAHLFRDDDDRWEAVKRRDQSADGLFYYSVVTTGVFCRPSCRSRIPRRENVRFHTSTEEAEKDGFRPCKRCRPNGPSRQEQQALIIERACQLLESGEKTPNLKTLAEILGVSPFHFHRLFKAAVGLTPKNYAVLHRSKRDEPQDRGNC